MGQVGLASVRSCRRAAGAVVAVVGRALPGALATAVVPLPLALALQITLPFPTLPPATAAIPRCCHQRGAAVARIPLTVPAASPLSAAAIAPPLLTPLPPPIICLPPPLPLLLLMLPLVPPRIMPPRVPVVSTTLGLSPVSGLLPA
jgi:hypothetical protein